MMKMLDGALHGVSYGLMALVAPKSLGSYEEIRLPKKE